MNPYSRYRQIFSKGVLSSVLTDVVSNYKKLRMFDQLQEMPTEEISYLHLQMNSKNTNAINI